MNEVTFEQRWRAHGGRQIDKWAHYGRIYDQHLAPFWARAKRVLEIGVDHGGSLQILKAVFRNAEIVGLDINPDCKRFEEDRISIMVGDQTDSAILETLGNFDIVIDDGSHVPAHQSTTFSYLWPSTRSVYLIEDCHSGYPNLVTLSMQPILHRYPWVIVAEKPERVIRGTPSRELRQDEQEARSQSNG